MDPQQYIDLLREIAAIKRELAELKKPEVPRWMTWTPTVTQSVSVTFTTTFARYVLTGNTVYIRARLAITSAGTTGNSVVVGGLPFAFANAAGNLGVMRIFDSGTGNYVGALTVSTSTSVVGVAHGLTSNIGITPNFALASGDVIDISGAYER